MDYVVRPAISEDVESITRLCIETAPFEGTGEPGEVEFYNKLFAESIADVERLLVVAEESDTIVGFACAEVQHEPDDCAPAPHVSLDMIGVKPSRRGHGIARAIMEKVHSWSGEKGVGVIQLAVGEVHTPAIGLYEALGYRTVMRKMQKRL